MLTSSLTSGGFEVTTAVTIGEAIEALTNNDITAVLLDLTLPDSSGIDTFHTLHEQFPLVPIVVLTGLDDAATGLAALIGGAQDYLVKGQPNNETLIRCLRYAIERNRIRLKLIESEARVSQLVEELEFRVKERTAELERSNHELWQFAKVASHDLQEPLRTLEGYVNLLSRRYHGQLDKNADEYIGFILESTKTMAQLIQGVLAHSNIKTAHSHNEVINCSSVLDEALANLHSSIQEHQAVTTHDNLPNIRASRSEITQLFQNLLANAIKFHKDETPRVHVSAEASNDTLLFSVKDNGIGIDEAHKDKIFDMFARLHSRQEYPGTGMGLAICKKIVESYQGDIWCESQPGEGTTFKFKLPAIH